MKRCGTALLLVGILLPAPAPLGAQARPGFLEVKGPDLRVARVPIVYHRGFASLSGDALSVLGWTFYRDGEVARARSAGGHDLVLRAENPWALWGDELLQMTEAPYFFGERIHVPVQVAVDLLPRILPDVYGWDPHSDRLSIADEAYWRPGQDASVIVSREAPPAQRPDRAAALRPGAEPAAAPPVVVPSAPAVRESTEPVTRLVVIDPGHGGRDPGTVGGRGLREKDVALSVARRLADRLSQEPDLEVRLTRDDDILIPIWQRGELATEWRGERPGVFVSLHANASPRSRSVRGFETYFLSEARTEHERRVAANENAPLALRGDDPVDERDPDLDFILKELRNLDHQHWSALLAEMIQEELQPVHPGPNRGVKQGPLAVITNALMPAVLVEVGFLTNPQEERLLGQSGFHRDAADAIADAVLRFFQRYPPGPEDPGEGEP